MTTGGGAFRRRLRMGDRPGERSRCALSGRDGPEDPGAGTGISAERHEPGYQ